MKKIKSIVNSQKSAIIILLIFNLLQFRELGLIHIKLKEMAHQLTLFELEIELHRDFQK